MRRCALLVLSFVLVMTGCDSSGSDTTAPRQPLELGDIVADHWVLESLEVGGGAIALPAEIARYPSVQFQWNGFYLASDGCNSTSGKYTLEGFDLAFETDRFWTAAGCPDAEPVMNLRSAFSTVWFDIEAVEIDRDLLQIVSAAGSAALRRRPGRDWPLSGTRWSFHEGRSPMPTQLLFDLEAGILTADSLCLRTTFDLEPNEEGFTATTIDTADVCPDDVDLPPRFMPTQDTDAKHNSIVLFLSGGFEAQLAADTLRLIGPGGEAWEAVRTPRTSLLANDPPIVAPGDEVLGFAYDGSSERHRISVLASGTWIATQSRWEWAEGTLSVELLGDVTTAMEETRLTALRRSLREEGDGGCSQTGGQLVSDLNFAKNPQAEFGCELQAAPEAPVLAAAMEIVREIAAALEESAG